jgi:hypothetical protein
MFIQRLGGLLIGFFVGMLPFINTLAASFFAFNKKRRRIAVFYLVTAVISFGSIVAFNHYENKEKAADQTFMQTFQANLQEVTVKSDVLIDTLEMETILKQVLTNTAHQLIRKDARLEDIFRSARDNKLSASQEAAFHKFSVAAQRDYASKTATQTGKDRFNLFFDRSALDGPLGQDARDFLKDYLYNEKSLLYILSVCLVAITFFTGWVGSIRQGWDLFIKSPDHTSSNRDRNNDPLYRAFEAISTATSGPLPQQVEVNEIRDNPPPRREAEQQDSGAAGTIKVNTAGEEELMQLRGVNRILAKTIIAERNIGGYFTGIADLQKRIDLATEQVERIRKNLDFEVPKRGGGRVIEY